MENANFIISSTVDSKFSNLNQYKNENKLINISENVFKFKSQEDDEDDLSSLYLKGTTLRRENKIIDAINIFLKCQTLYETKFEYNNISIYYETFINLALLTPQTKENYKEISKYYNLAIKLCPDRCEPYYYFSIYCNLIHVFEKSYELLTLAINISYEESCKKYNNVQATAYGKYLFFDLAVASCELEKYDEGLKLLNIIESDDDFQFMNKRICETKKYFEIKKNKRNRSDDKLPTLIFISMCKNEERVIKETLESVYKYIDYWIICDTGSTDNTCKIITEFFSEKNIPGELFIDEWKGFDVNKTLMFERAYGISDFVLHLDADDWLCGDFDKNVLINNENDMFFFNYKRGNTEWLSTSLYNNKLRWKYVGVAHNIIICLDNKTLHCSNEFVKKNIWIDGNERGFRALDPKKYLIDAEKLEKQFFDTLYEDPYNLTNRSVFYAAQSYFDYKDLKTAFKWYNLYTKLKNIWIEELFESYLKLIICGIELKHPESELKRHFDIAVNIFDDRSEPYILMANYHFSKNEHEKAYQYFLSAKKFDYETVKNKYILFINKYNYGKYINDNMSVSCSYINKREEGINLINEILEDEEFITQKERLLKNIRFMK